MKGPPGTFARAKILDAGGVEAENDPSVGAMWICPKCGEALENQFRSCWKCAGLAEEPPKVQVPVPVRWPEYFGALLLAYLIPWLAVLLLDTLSVVCGSAPLVLEALIYRSIFTVMAWMAVPALITFLMLLPFVRYRDVRRFIAGLLFLAWVLVAFTHFDYEVGGIRLGS